MAGSKLTHTFESVSSLVERGLALHRRGDRSLADGLYEAALLRDPQNATAWYLRSVIALESGNARQAAALLESAVRCAPDNPVFLCNLGEAYRRLARLDDAVAALRRAVVAGPTLAEAQFNLGVVLRQRGDRADGLVALATAVAAKATLPRGLVVLLNALREDGDAGTAVAMYERYAALVPESAELLAAAAVALAAVNRLDEALPHFQRALVLDPASANAHSDYANGLADVGRIDDAIAHCRRALEIDPDHRVCHGNLVYYLAFAAEADGSRLREAAVGFGRRHADCIAATTVHTNSRACDRQLRIGYVSPDFRQHSVAHFVLPLLAHHDRNAFHVTCYSNVQRQDDITAGVRALCDRWRDIAALDDDHAANLVREDGIDILVDLAMHTAHTRLMVFARKPAPVQLCWLAYPGTTGIRAMDYRITDPFLDPPGADDGQYIERSIRLPETFWCFDPLSGRKVGPLPALTTGGVTFGNTSNMRKVSEATLALWARVLSAVPDSRLRTFAPLGEARLRILATLARGGIAPERVDFFGHAPRESFLDAYDQIDCCLDTTPYSGGTATLDAFWMGVPVVTLRGNTVVGRSGVSLASNLDLPQLIASTPDEYVARAVDLVSDRSRLSDLRRTLRSRMEASSLMDSPRFAANLERAFREMWARWCATSETQEGAALGDAAIAEVLQ